jgi:hypothetical protein
VLNARIIALKHFLRVVRCKGIQVFGMDVAQSYISVLAPCEIIKILKIITEKKIRNNLLD